METKVRTIYLHQHPRRFANECSVIRVRADDRDTVDYLTHIGYTRLTAREMARHLRWVDGENGAWASGRAFGPTGGLPTEISVDRGPPCSLCGEAVTQAHGWRNQHPSCQEAYGS